MRTERQNGKLGAQKLRELASWYREFAGRAGNCSISCGRLRMAEDLDREADSLERSHARKRKECSDPAT